MTTHSAGLGSWEVDAHIIPGGIHAHDRRTCPSCRYDRYQPKHCACNVTWCGTRLKRGDVVPAVGVTITVGDVDHVGALRFCSWICFERYGRTHTLSEIYGPQDHT